MKRNLVAIFIIGVAVLGVGGLLTRRLVGSAPVAEAQKKATLVKVFTVESGTIARTLQLTGSVEPQRHAQLASPAEGPIANLRVREGDRVRAGEPLVSIGRKDAVDARIVSLREELSEVEENLRRIDRLVESGAVPGERLDEARTRRERARAALVAAEEAARDYTIRAPWDGVVSRAHVRDGDFVTPRSTLLELYDPIGLVIIAAVPERDAAAVRTGMSVTATLDAHPGASFVARILRVHPYLEERTRTRTIEVEITDAVDLLPGMFARLRVPLETASAATIVPIEALVVSPAGGRVVFAVQEGKAVRRPVETGIEDGGRVQILTGIEPGEKVIIAGHERVRDGVAVRVAGASGPKGGEAQGTKGPAGKPKSEGSRP